VQGSGDQKDCFMGEGGGLVARRGGVHGKGTVKSLTQRRIQFTRESIERGKGNPFPKTKEEGRKEGKLMEVLMSTRQKSRKIQMVLA